MRASWTVFFLLAAAGIAVGWFGRDLVGDRTTPPDRFGADFRSFSGAAPTAPGLAGRGEAPAARPGLSDADVEALRRFEVARPAAPSSADAPPEPDRSLPALRALAVLHAIAARPDDFARVADAYIVRGGEASLLLDALLGVERALIADALEALLDQRGLDPLSPVAVATALHAAKRTDRALEIVRAAVHAPGTVDPELFALLLRIAPHQALEIVRTAPEYPNWDGDVWRGVAEKLGAEAALLAPLYVARLRDEPDDQSALVGLGAVDHAAAVPFARERVARHPDEAWGWKFLASQVKALGDMDAAFDAWRRVMSISPDRSTLDAIAAIDRDRALTVIAEFDDRIQDDETLGHAGNLLRDAGRREEAAAYFLRAIEKDPRDGEWLRGLSQVDGARAVSILLERMQPDPMAHDDESIGDLADAYRGAGDPLRAADLYEAALSKDPEDSEWINGLIQTDAARAVGWALKRAEANPAHAGAQGTYGRALVAAGRRTDGLRLIERAAELDPDWLGALADVDADRAVSLAHARVASLPKDPAAHRTLANVLRQLGRTAEAEEAERRASALPGGDARRSRRPVDVELHETEYEVVER